MVGGKTIVNGDPLLACPDTVTTTLPVVAPTGTVTVMLVALQALAAAAAVPLKVTALDPCAVPKLVPVMVIDAPTVPAFWLRLVMVGGGGRLMRILRAWMAVIGVMVLESVTLTVKFAVPLGPVGFPEIVPAPLRVRPAGNVPALMENVTAPAPPVFAIAWLYAVPSTPAGSVV